MLKSAWTRYRFSLLGTTALAVLAISIFVGDASFQALGTSYGTLIVASASMLAALSALDAVRQNATSVGQNAKLLEHQQTSLQQQLRAIEQTDSLLSQNERLYLHGKAPNVVPYPVKIRGGDNRIFVGVENFGASAATVTRVQVREDGPDGEVISCFEREVFLRPNEARHLFALEPEHWMSRVWFQVDSRWTTLDRDMSTWEGTVDFSGYQGVTEDGMPRDVGHTRQVTIEAEKSEIRELIIRYLKQELNE